MFISRFGGLLGERGMTLNSLNTYQNNADLAVMAEY